MEYVIPMIGVVIIIVIFVLVIKGNASHSKSSSTTSTSSTSSLPRSASPMSSRPKLSTADELADSVERAKSLFRDGQLKQAEEELDRYGTSSEKIISTASACEANFLVLAVELASGYVAIATHYMTTATKHHEKGENRQAVSHALEAERCYKKAEIAYNTNPSALVWQPGDTDNLWVRIFFGIGLSAVILDKKNDAKKYLSQCLQLRADEPAAFEAQQMAKGVLEGWLS